MPVVELPNGQEVEFPDGVTPDQMNTALRRDFAQYFDSRRPGDLRGEEVRRVPTVADVTRGGAPTALPSAAAAASHVGDVLRGVPQAIGEGMGFVGDLTRAGVADIASNVAGTEFAGNVPAVITGQPLPVDQALADASEEQEARGEFPLATVLGHTSQGLAKIAPKLAAIGVVGGPTLLGQSLAAGGLFGLDDEGNFHPKEAAFAALFPVVGKLGRLGGAIGLSKLARGGSQAAANPTVQKAVELAADNAAQFAYATATQTPELIELSRTNPQQFKQSLGELIAMQLGFSLLGLRHLRGEVPSETQRWIQDRGQEIAVKLATDQKYADAIDTAVIEAMNPRNAQERGQPAAARPGVPERPYTPEQRTAFQLLRQEGVSAGDAEALLLGEKTVKEVVEGNLKEFVTPAWNADVSQAQGGHGEAWVMGYNLAIERLGSIMDLAVAKPKPETPATLDAQANMLQTGQRSIMLVTPGESVPDVPAGFTRYTVKGVGKFIFDPAQHTRAQIREAVKRDTIGDLLGYGIPRKPAPENTAGVVTVRSPEGVEKQAVVTDEVSLPNVVKAAERVVDPGDTVQIEPPGKVLARRESSPAPRQGEVSVAGEAATGARGGEPPQATERIQELRQSKTYVKDEAGNWVLPEESAAAAKVEKHVAEVAQGDKAVRMEDGGSKQTGPRPAKEIKSELVQRLEKEIAKLGAEPELLYSDPITRKGKREFSVYSPDRSQHVVVRESYNGDWIIELPAKSQTDVKGKTTGTAAKELARSFGDIRAATRMAESAMQKLLGGDKKPITIRIPGDGVFTIERTHAALGEVLRRVQGLTTASGQRTKVLPTAGAENPAGFKRFTEAEWADPGIVKTLENLLAKEPESSKGQRALFEEALRQARMMHQTPQPEPRGTSAMGFPAAAAPVPPTPSPAPAPGVTMIQHGRLPVTLQRTAPGSVSVPQIMDAMQRVLKVSGSDAGLIRTGRFLQRALGIWKPHEEIIRLESADSIPTATHEVGHGLQQMIYGTAKASGLKFLGPAIRRELVGMGKALYGSRKPAAGYTGEGFAEFARYWLTTEDAPRVAPNMTRFFEQQFLPAHPDVARALTDARDLVTVWRQQGSVERAQRQLVREPGALQRIARALAQAVGYQSLFESGAPIEAVSKAAARKLGRPLSPSEDPFKLFSWKRGSAGATVERMATEHMLDVWGNPVGPSLAEALAPVKNRRKEFLLYVWAQAAEMRWRQGKNPGISLEDAQHIKATYDSPEFRLAADKYRKWNDQLLDYVVQADPSMADAVKAMRGANDFYAPLARMIDPAKAKAAAAQKQSNAFMRMWGSGLPVKDIFDQTFINAARMVNRANRALVARNIVKLSNVPGLGHIVEEVPRDRVAEKISIEQVRKQLESMGVDTSMVPQDEILQYYSLADVPKGTDPIVSVKDATGRTRWYQVDARLYDTLEGLQTYSLKNSFPGLPYLGQMLDLVVGMPARAFRLGTTGLRPAFSLVTNPSRDLATLLAQTSSNPAKAAAMYPGALREAVAGGPYKAAFYDLGAHLGQPLGTDIGHTKRVSTELFHGRVMKVVRNPVDHLRELLSITESAPRIAELKAVADDIGWQPGRPLTPDQAVQLGLAAKRVTVDFSAMGELSRIINTAVPFFNPALQGMRAFGRAFQQNPAKATLVGLTLFTGPALALWWKNKDKEWYKALPWRERYLYTNIDDGRNVWRIPRPFEWGNAFMVVPEALLDSWYRREPEAARQALEHVFESSNPVDYPVLAKLAKEQWQNRIDFWDRPIVPRSEVDLPASEQIGPYTSRLSIAINKAFPDLSPRRVDAAIRGYFGGVGTDVMDLLGVGAQRQDREWEASDLPVFGTLFRRGGQFNAQNQHINDFWDLYLPSRARVDGYNYARAQVEKGLRRPETLPAISNADRAVQAMGENAAPALRLLLTLAARTKVTKARAELYREAGEIARTATENMRKAHRAEQEPKRYPNVRTP